MFLIRTGEGYVPDFQITRDNATEANVEVFRKVLNKLWEHLGSESSSSPEKCDINFQCMYT